jgi:hypothetical protein
MMKYQAGQSGNLGGRPKGSVGGRVLALSSLDKLLAKRKNQRALIAALEKDMQRDPVRFFKTVIMPLLPKESKLSIDHDGIVEWKSLVEAFPKPGPAFAPATKE